MKNFAILISAFLPLAIAAQQLPYQFSAFNQTFNYLSSPFSVNNGETWDDPEYVVPAGFNFNVMGTQSNAFLLQGTGGGLMPASFIAPYQYLYIYASDIIDAGYIDGVSLSPISYKVEGNAPNRIFKLEWKNCAFFNELEGLGTSTNQISFQFWLYETTNDIEFRYGPHSVKSSEVHLLGKPIVAIFMNVNENFDGADGAWLLGGNPNSPTPVPYTDFEALPNNSQMLSFDIPNGTVYRFATGIVDNPEIEQPLMVAYPTIVQEQLMLMSPWSEQRAFAIVDMNGRTVFNGQLQPGLNSIDTSGLGAGNYLLLCNEGRARFMKQ